MQYLRLVKVGVLLQNLTLEIAWVLVRRLKGHLKSGIKVFKICASKNTKLVYTLKFLYFFLFFQVIPTCFC